MGFFQKDFIFDIQKIIYISIKILGVFLKFLCLDVIIRRQKSVPLNYHISKRKCFPKLHNLLYIFICIVPPNYPFSSKNVCLNLTICFIYLCLLFPLTTTFHKKCSLKLLNLLHIFIRVVPLNYHFS